MELNENIIVSLSDLFKTDKEVVTKALTDKEADGSFIDSFKNQNIIRPKQEHETWLRNREAEIAQEAKNNHILELKEKAKSKELPQELYSFFKGNVSEELERKLSKAAGISEYENYEDLVNKVISSKGTDDSIKAQLKELQQRNLELQSEKENALNEAKGKYDTELIDFDKRNVFESLNLDYSEEAKPKQLQLLRSQVDSNYKYVRQDGKTLVTDLNGNIIKNKNTLEPVTLRDVVLSVAKDYDFKIKSPESGGQGGSSSQSNNISGVTWEEYAAANKVQIGTSQADKLYVKWKEHN